jgi:phosphatidylinositol alpha-mannosyltransferase
MAPCRRFVERMGLEDVLFAGYVPDEEVPRYYRSAHIFCAPNTGAESQGIVLLEAMASGLPIVASRIEGFAEVVEDGRQGFLVPPGDGHALAEALDHLLADEALRQSMAQEGLRTAALYSWGRVAEQVLSYYREVAGA